MVVGWMFERGDDMAWVFLEDEDAARAKAVVALGGEPTADAVMLPEGVRQFFKAGSGQVVLGRVFDRFTK
ncbi:hypothetical protein LGH82_10960 [Mesorhizobium sp. PAMC28654]|uniref:hypothetical protein n=1 Tax=Mesorhizobium sp. PAMC28654 TaxID=2880934 RepID=UPI001D0A0BCD|nr:hypothetical protein [Mesorhizobium sp. PAMC28654]UDL91703.1 hypothetical protein LGH82_10960 [Mesorhizobium sp. PAMC28654]